MQHNRSYALTNEARNVLAAVARAMFARRIQEGRSQPDAVPSQHAEFFDIIQRLNDCGCNVLQERPSDPPPTPKPWLDPVTGEALPNPWLDPKNLKGQSILQQRDPALAAHFKAMAADNYGTLAKWIDAEVERKTLESIPYGDAEHQVNVFRGNNQTEQAQFSARAPRLAAFYKNEARDVEIPIFGKQKNMTIAGRLSKDPSIGALVQVASRVHEDWLAQDKAAAQEQRAAAEEALRKLESQAA